MTALDRLARLARDRDRDRAFRIERALIEAALDEAAMLAKALREREDELRRLKYPLSQVTP